MSPEVPHKNRPLTNVVGLATVFLIFPLGVAFIVAWVLATILLHLALLVAWLPRGRRVLFVSSDDPRWKAYLDEQVVPRLPKTAARLDWSARDRWSPFDLGVWLFRMWSGPREYNPIAIVVRPWRGPRVYRLYEAFEEAERGRPARLRDASAELLAAVGSR
jgi:hypothetical protein